MGYPYKWMRDHDCPIADKNGKVLEHRWVLYQKIGPRAHKCYICNAPLNWGGNSRGALLVDHLDDDKMNNDPANLRPACSRCNAWRWRDDELVIEVLAGSWDG